jgi:arylsulfatase A-like enzyme
MRHSWSKYGLESLLIRLLVIGLILMACGGDGERVNILLIGIDTLRQDHLGCYGYEREISPYIDELSGRGTLCENALSQCPWTLPSFASVLTSLYPSQHGAGINMNSMRTTFPTLAELLAEAGYRTGAIINVSVLSPEFGVARGFEHYDACPAGVRRTADVVTDLALEWLGGNGDRPFFCFVHYFDPHLSYSPPAPYDTLFDPGYDGPVGKSFDRDKFLEMKDRLYAAKDAQTAADWFHIEALYDGEIAFTDEAVGRLLKGIEERGLYDNTLVILLSDHGEEFLEHGGFGHGHTLYNEVIQIPLIFSLPGVLPKGARVKRQVRLIDVMPTVLELAGILGDYRLEGSSLVSLLKGEGPPRAARGCLFPPSMAYSEGLHRGGERKGLAAYPWKFVHHLPTGDEMLFNLADDPDETKNLIYQEPEPLSPLRSMVFRNLLAMSETWYLTVADDGQARTFDLRIFAEKGDGIGKIYFHRFFDEAGEIVDLEQGLWINELGSELRVKHLEIDGPMTLAFKVETPAGVPVSFDLHIDGRPAIAETYIGESLKQPKEMPFAPRRGRAAVKQATGHEAAPRPPYFIVWYRGNQYGNEAKATLSETTRRELKALGYIQ